MRTCHVCSRVRLKCARTACIRLGPFNNIHIGFINKRVIMNQIILILFFIWNYSDTFFFLDRKIIVILGQGKGVKVDSGVEAFNAESTCRKSKLTDFSDWKILLCSHMKFWCCYYYYYYFACVCELYCALHGHEI